jgi:hypothetical protein
VTTTRIEKRLTFCAVARFLGLVPGYVRAMPRRVVTWELPLERRLAAWASIVLWCVTATLLVSIAQGAVATAAIAVPCVLLAPGLALVLVAHFRGLALTLTVVLLTGLALGVLVPSILLYAGAWSPRAAFVIIVDGTLLAASAGMVSAVHRTRETRRERSPHARRPQASRGESRRPAVSRKPSGKRRA